MKETKPTTESLHRMTKFMKSLLLTGIVMLMLSGSVFAQADTYRVDEYGDYQASVLEGAMNSANFDSYRKPQSEVVLNFENGARVALLPASELVQRGIPVDESRLLAEDVVPNPDRRFSIHSSGIIMENVPVNHGK